MLLWFGHSYDVDCEFSLPLRRQLILFGLIPLEYLDRGTFQIWQLRWLILWIHTLERLFWLVTVDQHYLSVLIHWSLHEACNLLLFNVTHHLRLWRILIEQIIGRFDPNRVGQWVDFIRHSKWLWTNHAFATFLFHHNRASFFVTARIYAYICLLVYHISNIMRNFWDGDCSTSCIYQMLLLHILNFKGWLGLYYQGTWGFNQRCWVWQLNPCDVQFWRRLKKC